MYEGKPDLASHTVQKWTVIGDGQARMTIDDARHLGRRADLIYF